MVLTQEKWKCNKVVANLHMLYGIYLLCFWNFNKHLKRVFK